METEVAGLIGAERHGRTGERVAYRNGNRTRMWDTRMGTIELAIPKVTPGTYVPSLLQPRRRGRARLRRRAGSVRARRLDAKGRCPGQGSGRGRDLNVGGLADLRGTRHGGGGVSDAPVDGGTSVSLGGCDVPQGPRGRPGYQPRHGAGCISCGIYWPRCRTGCGRRSRPSSARSLRSRTTPRR